MTSVSRPRGRTSSVHGRVTHAGHSSLMWKAEEPMQRIVISFAIVLGTLAACDSKDPGGDTRNDTKVDAGADDVDPVVAKATQLIDEGRQTFRYDTFGDEAFWGGALKLHQAIAGEANGGVGDGVS